MTKLVEVKISDLSGAALDWAVAQIEKPEGFGLRREFGDRGRMVAVLVTDVNDPESEAFADWSPSTDWWVAGPLILKYDIGLAGEGCACVIRKTSPGGLHIGATGRTLLIAAMRAIVLQASYPRGGLVAVPEVLLCA